MAMHTYWPLLKTSIQKTIYLVLLLLHCAYSGYFMKLLAKHIVLLLFVLSHHVAVVNTGVSLNTVKA